MAKKIHVHDKKCDYLSLFSVFKLKKFEISSPFDLLVILQIFEVEDDIYSKCTLHFKNLQNNKQVKRRRNFNFFNLNTEKGRNHHIFCHEHEYYLTIYTFLTKNDAYTHYLCI